MKWLMVVLGGLTLAIVLTRLWYNEFNWNTTEDERHVARTEDGWNIGIYRYKPKGKVKPFPIILSHGMAGTRYIYDLHPRYSLARYLADHGFDTYLIDLRGRESSWPDSGSQRSLRWTFDDFVQQDFPAALEKVLQLSSAKQSFFIGLELSGQVLYAAAIEGLADKIRGAVTLGSPVIIPPVAGNDRRKPSVGGRVPISLGAKFAGPVLAHIKAGVLDRSFRSENVDPVVVSRYLLNGVPDESTGLTDQVTAWVRQSEMSSLSGTRYDKRLDEITLPLLMMVAEKDVPRPPESVEAAFEAMGSVDKTLVRAGKAAGFAVDYGHDDIAAGLHSPAEIFPKISEWLDQHSVQTLESDHFKSK